MVVCLIIEEYQSFVPVHIFSQIMADLSFINVSFKKKKLNKIQLQTSYQFFKVAVIFLLFKKILFIFREGRERDRERNIDVW